MAQERTESANFWREMFALGVYKRSQGRMIRQITFAALAITIALGAWRLNVYSVDGGLVHLIVSSMTSEQSAGAREAAETVDRYIVPAVLLCVGLWVSFRVVNYPRFADFLIAVEAEVNKVSWPSKGELVRSTIVVLLTIFALALILFAYDFIWRLLLTMLGITGG